MLTISAMKFFVTITKLLYVCGIFRSCHCHFAGVARDEMSFGRTFHRHNYIAGAQLLFEQVECPPTNCMTSRSGFTYSTLLLCRIFQSKWKHNNFLYPNRSNAEPYVITFQILMSENCSSRFIITIKYC